MYKRQVMCQISHCTKYSFEDSIDPNCIRIRSAIPRAAHNTSTMYKVTCKHTCSYKACAGDPTWGYKVFVARLLCQYKTACFSEDDDTTEDSSLPSNSTTE